MLGPRGSAKRNAAAIHGDRSLNVLERCFADEAVMADPLDIEQTSVGRKPILRGS